MLVNNAGGQYMSPAEDITPKGFRTVVRLNLEGTWLMTHAVATKAMIPAGGGKVVNVTLSPHNGLPGMAHSSAARAAVENMTRALSIEWARFGIRVNAIATGHFETDALRSTREPVRRGSGGHGAAAAARARPRSRRGWWPTSPRRRATTSRARSSRSTARATTGSGPGRRWQ